MGTEDGAGREIIGGCRNANDTMDVLSRKEGDGNESTMEKEERKV